MTYFLGIDGGGTKTDCVLLDSQGQVLRRAQGGPSNPLRSGYTRAWFSVSGAADTVLARQSLKATDIRGICGGFGGAARPAVARRMSVFLERSFPKAEVKVTSDIEIALAAAVEKGPGIVLIAGTGSVAYGRNADGKTERAGGWGPWLAIRAVLLISAAAPSPLSGATRMVWGRRRNFRIEFLKIWNGATGAL